MAISRSNQKLFFWHHMEYLDSFMCYRYGIPDYTVNMARKGALAAGMDGTFILNIEVTHTPILKALYDK